MQMLRPLLAASIGGAYDNARAPAISGPCKTAVIHARPRQTAGAIEYATLKWTD